MMIRFNKFLALAFVLSLFMYSCESDSNNSAADYQQVNNWIYENMDNEYFWYNTLSSKDEPGTLYPEDYFYSLVYSSEDKWSYITDDVMSLVDDLVGTPVSMGYSPAFGRINGTNDVFMLIEYVYDDSPAKRAGLKRGDLVLSINNKQLDVDNYVDLFYAENQVLNFGTISNNTISPSTRTMSMTAEQLDVNPALFHKVYSENGVKVGYLVITEFIEKVKFVQKVSNALLSLKNEGASELIIDLRYNGGGYMLSAQWLASALAPTSAVSRKALLTQLYYNDKIETTITDDDRYIHMIENDVNFNLDKVVFLTASGTASASELVMIGLYPYMNVIQIGENTYGKYTGSRVIADDHIPMRHNWAIMPIIMKYANANGYTDFKTGLTPNYLVEDDLVSGYPLGDKRDPLLSTAIGICSGLTKSYTVNKSPGYVYEHLNTPSQLRKKNLFVSE